MSSSQITIINMALTMLGEERITTLADANKTTRAVNAVYDVLLAKELRARLWSFTKTRAQLAANVTVPLFGYGRAYDLPADCLRLLSINNWNLGPDQSDYRGGSDRAPYTIEGRQIITDAENDATTGTPIQMNIVYVRLIEDTSQWDGAFTEYFAAKLAFRLAEPLTQSQSKKQSAAQDAAESLAEAIRANAVELPADYIEDDTWITSRLRN